MEGALGVFDLTGGKFLALYCVLFVVVFMLGIVIPRWLRPEGRMMPVSDPEHLAYLAGGKDRFTDAVLAKLMATKAVEAGKARFAINGSAGGSTAAERAVLGLGVAASLKEIRKSLAAEAERIDRTLTGYGLLMEKSTRRLMRWCQVSPYIALFVFGAIKWEVGSSRDKPVGFLTVLLIVTLVVALARFFMLEPGTRAGQEVLANATQASDRLRRSPMEAETGMAVALFGTSVLAGSQFAALHQLRSSSGSSTSSGCTTGCSGGDSGCSGGGCGGCGGD